jgi:hypothetical protein
MNGDADLGTAVPARSPSVFLSYSSLDKERFAQGLAARLRARGIDVWFDDWEILPGDSLVDRIFEHGLASADVVIVVLSRNSVASPWVREELHAGLHRRIAKEVTLIPVVIDDCEIPTSLHDTKWLRIGDLTNYERELGELVGAILRQDSTPPLGASNYDRTYHLVSAEWGYYPSEVSTDHWGASTVGSRSLTSLVAGLRGLNISYPLAEELGDVVYAGGPPSAELLRWSRTGEGEVVLARPHKRSGLIFAFWLRFEPPLGYLESAELAFRVQFPVSRFAYLEDLQGATADAAQGPRDFEYNRRSVDYPVERLVFSTFLPTLLGATPLGVDVEMRRRPFDEERQFIVQTNAFSTTRTVRDGRDGWLSRLERDHPPLKASYRIRWAPPSRVGGETAE